MTTDILPITLPAGFEDDERGNVLLTEPEGEGFAAWLRTGVPDHWLEVTFHFHNYPSLEVKTVRRTDAELLAHIRDDLEGWFVRKLNLECDTGPVKGGKHVPGPPTCRECGEPCFVTPVGVSHHADEAAPDGIDHDADADHVAVPDEEDDADDA